jgi:predicted neuraminidase
MRCALVWVGLILFVTVTFPERAAAQGLVEFGAPFALNTNAASDAGHDGDPQVTTDGHGNWVAVWQSFDSLGGTIGTDTDILVARSTDAGTSWTAPEPLNTNADSDVGNDWRPQVTTDAQGTWVAVWYSFDSLGETIETDADILVARSTDAGVSWTAPEPLNTNAASDVGGDRRPQVTTDAIGTWVAVWYSTDSFGDTIGTDEDILVARSTDAGVTWTPPAALNTNAGSDRWEDFRPQLTTDGQGTWIAVWHSYDSLGGTLGLDGDILVARSTDAGVSWTAPEPLNTNAASDGADDYRAQVTTDAQGTWVAVWVQSTKKDAVIRVARSTDAGVSWTAPKRLNNSASSSRVNDRLPQVTTDALGTWVAVWYSDDSLGGTIGADDDILEARSTDGGSTWTKPVALSMYASCDSNNDWGPQLTTDGQGNWIAVWFSSDSLGGTIDSDDDIFAALPGPDPVRCQTRGQQACINALNGDFAKLARAQDSAIVKCVKNKARRDESATACLALPNRGVDRAWGKTQADEARRCSEMPPDFGPLDADTVNEAAVAAERATLSELFGPDLDAALVSQADDKSAAKCQEAVVKVVHKCQNTQIKEFNRCKKTALKKGGATSPEVLARCLGFDPRGRIAKKCDPVSGPLATKVLPRTCDVVDLSAAFPGCGTAVPDELTSCLDEAVACRVCLGLSEADGLGEDCDLFDDGVANASCQ